VEERIQKLIYLEGFGSGRQLRVFLCGGRGGRGSRSTATKWERCLSKRGRVAGSNRCAEGREEREGVVEEKDTAMVAKRGKKEGIKRAGGSVSKPQRAGNV